jgi:S-DNA-T family DNA segregation ATPase FtsK/SpoIIIE
VTACLMVWRNMQFPPSRIPVSNPDNTDRDDGRTHAAPHADKASVDDRPQTEAAPDAVILDPEKLPVWQRAFILGPNVRFGRTPGPAVLKGEPMEAAAHPGIAGAKGPASDAGIQPASSANYVIGRSNPMFAPPAKVEGSPVGDLQRQIAEALTQASEAGEPRHRLPSETHLAWGLVLPPRTGAPLRVPPRAPREPQRAEAAQPINRHPVQHAVHAPSAPVAQPAVERPAVAVRPVAPSASTRSQPPIAAAQVATRPADPQVPAASSRPSALIPDHLLWEMMSLGGSETAEPHAGSRVKRTPPPAASVPQPTTIAAAPKIAPVIATVVRMAPPSGPATLSSPEPVPAPKSLSPSVSLLLTTLLRPSTSTGMSNCVARLLS